MTHHKKYMTEVTFADPACYWIFDSLVMSMCTGQRLG